MNAAEAKKLSEENADKIAEKNLKIAIEMMEKNIKKVAEIGCFSTTISVCTNPHWYDSECTERFKSYFREKGFSVGIRTGDDNGNVLIMECSWFV